MIENNEAESQYKIIFMDFSMPEMDGIEATKMIQKFLKETSMKSKADGQE